MVQRCTSQKHKNWADYGGRGITVCSRWRAGDGKKSGFECFFEDMGEKPSPKHGIDRKDVNDGYSKSNCRWVTQQTQMRNTRANHLLTFAGETMPMIEWAERLSLPYQTLLQRIRARWSIHRACTEPHSGRHAH